MDLVSDPLIIRSHIDSICAIEEATFNPPWQKNDFLNDLKGKDDCGGMILLDEEVVLGYLFFRKPFDEIDIDKICIHPDSRGRGYGKLLLSGFIERMKGSSSKMFLEVSRTNTAAVRLYDACGFRINRVRKGLSADGGDVLEMVLVKGRT